MSCYHPYLTIFNYPLAYAKMYNLKNSIKYMSQINYNTLYDRLDAKREILFRIKDKQIYLLPCGKCLGCKIQKAREWSYRLDLESKSYKSNYFVTLTYEQPPLNDNKTFFTLSKKDLQDFLKRLRSYFDYHYNFKGLRFFASGEYGSPKNTMRPHYHLILLNCPLEFEDLKLIGHHDMYDDYASSIIFKNWSYGRHTVNQFSNDTAFYVSRYTTKKIFKKSDDYDKINIEPEFITMSTKPGIGYDYFIKNKDKIIANDGVMINGRCVHTFKYYDKLLDKLCSNDFDLLKLKRHNVNTIHLDNIDNFNDYLDQLRREEENNLSFFQRLREKKL